MATSEPELTAATDLCDGRGRLDPAAVGWSRRPLHCCNLSGHPGRKKRWEYWCVTTATHLLTVTYADVDYLGIAEAAFLDFEEGRLHRRGIALPLAAGGWGDLGERVGEGDIHFERLGLRLAVSREAGGDRLQVAFKPRGGPAVEADVFCALPEDHDTHTVVIPWSERRFQLTSKHQCRPASGSATVGGRSYRFDESNGAFGCLDFGRGVWPWRTTWNWASASGVLPDGRTLGLNLGGQWTDGTGMTENGVVLGGRLDKIGEPLAFVYDRRDFTRPWTIRAPSGVVDLRFEPFFERREKMNLGLFASSVHQCFGTFTGRIVAHGEELTVNDLLGWSEEHVARW